MSEEKELESGISVPHATTQRAAVARLSKTLDKQLKQQGVQNLPRPKNMVAINQNTLFQFLQKTCLASDSVCVVESACLVLKHMVEDGFMDSFQAQEVLHSAIPRIHSNCCGVFIDITGDMQQLGVFLQKGGGSLTLCSIWELWPEHLPTISAKATGMLLTCTKKMIPVLWKEFKEMFTAILCDGTAAERLCVHSDLVRICGVSADLCEEVFPVLLSIIPHYQTGTAETEQYLSMCFSSLADAAAIYQHISDSFRVTLLRWMCIHIDSVHGCARPVLSLLRTMQGLTNCCPHALMGCPDVIAMLCVWICTMEAEHERIHVLRMLSSLPVTKMAQSANPIYAITLRMLVVCMLQLASSAQHSISKASSALLACAHQALLQERQCGENWQEMAVVGRGRLVGVHVMLNVLAHMWLKDDNRLVKAVRIQRKHHNLGWPGILIISATGLHPRPHVRKGVLDMLHKTVSSEHQWVGFVLLPFVLHILAYDVDPQVKLSAIYLLPKLATHPSAVAPVMHVISTLTTNTYLCGISLVLVARLHAIHPRIFHKLHEMVEKMYTPLSGDEVRLGAAKSVLEVCIKRPSRGVELIGVLNNILQDSHTAAVVLGLRALTVLIKEGILDVVSAWDAISEVLEDDGRPLVREHVALLFAESDMDDDGCAGVVQDIVPRLLLDVQHRDARVRAAAFKALAVFLRYLFAQSCIPTFKKPIDGDEKGEKSEESDGSEESESESESESGGDSEDEELAKEKARELVNGADIIQWLHENDPCVCSPCEKSVAEILSEDLSHYRKLVVKSRRVRVPVYDEFAALARTLHSMLQRSSTNPASRITLLPAMLQGYGIYTPAARDPKRELLSRSREFTHMLRELTNEMHIREHVVQLMMGACWKVYMLRHIKALIAAGKEGKEGGEENGARRVVEGLVQDVLDGCSDSVPHIAQNSMNALVGLACALPLLDSDFSDTFVTILHFLKKEALSSSGETVCIGLGMICSALHLTDGAHREDIVASLAAVVEKGGDMVGAASIGLGMAAQSLYSDRAHTPPSSRNNTRETQRQIRNRLFDRIWKVLVVGGEDVSLLEESMAGKCGAGLDQGIALAYCMHALELQGGAECKKRLLKSYNYLRARLTASLSDLSACTCAGCMVALYASTLCCYRMRIISDAEALQCATLLGHVCGQSMGWEQDMYAYVVAHSAWASLLHGLMVEGCQYSAGAVLSARSAWQLALSSTTPSSLHCVASLMGLSHLYGANMLLPEMTSSQQQMHNCLIFGSDSVALVKDTVAAIRTTYTGNEDTRVVRMAGLCMGAIAALSEQCMDTVAAPTQMCVEEMPVRSLLRRVIEALQQEDSPYSVPFVCGALNTFAIMPRVPVMNWTPLLQGALARADRSLHAVSAAVRFALAHCSSNTSLVSLLSTTWADGLHWRTLHPSLQCMILRAIPSLLSVFSASRACKLLRDCVANVTANMMYAGTLMDDLVVSLLLGLRDAAAMNDLPVLVKNEIHVGIVDTVSGWCLCDDVVGNVSDNDDDDDDDHKDDKSGGKDKLGYNVGEKEDVLGLLVVCLKFLPKNIRDELVKIDFTLSPRSQAKRVLIRSRCVMHGDLLVNDLQPCRTWLLRSTTSHEDALSVLPAVVSAASTVLTSPSSRSAWLIDTIDTMSLCDRPQMVFLLLSGVFMGWHRGDDASTVCQHEFREECASLLMMYLPQMLNTSLIQAREKMVTHIRAVHDSLRRKDGMKTVCTVLETLILSIK